MRGQEMEGTGLKTQLEGWELPILPDSIQGEGRPRATGLLLIPPQPLGQEEQATDG